MTDKIKLVVFLSLCAAVSAAAGEKYGLEDGWAGLQENLAVPQADPGTVPSKGGREIVSMPGVDEPELQEGWRELRDHFAAGQAPKDAAELAGEYTCVLYSPGEEGMLVRKFPVKIYGDAEGTKIIFSMPPDEEQAISPLAAGKQGAEMQLGGKHFLAIRKYSGWLSVMTDLYGEGTYGFMRKMWNVQPDKLRTLEDDMIHGGIPSDGLPLMQDTEVTRPWTGLNNDLWSTGHATRERAEASLRIWEKAFSKAGVKVLKTKTLKYPEGGWAFYLQIKAGKEFTRANAAVTPDYAKAERDAKKLAAELAKDGMTVIGAVVSSEADSGYWSSWVYYLNVYSNWAVPEDIR